MPKIIKFCKSEHNIASGCNTLQLGTFDYYREMDPDFSIADSKEGFIQYLGPEEPITINAEQLNSITGGVLQVNDKTTAGKQTYTHPGGTHIEMSGHEIIFDNGVMRANLDGKLDVKLFYPNAYLFCTSLVDDGQEPDPTAVSEEYDSYYEIQIKTIDEFVKSVTSMLVSQLTLDDLKLEKALSNFPIAGLRQPFRVICIHRAVEYVPEKDIRLNNPDDFTANRFNEIYRDSIFKKHDSHAEHKEYRFAFFLVHPMLGFFSAKSEPKLIDLKPISGFVATDT